MFKKIKITVVAALALLVISGAAFARGGHGNYGGNRGHDGGRNYRQNYRHCDYRPVYRGCNNYRARPVYAYPSRGIVITPFIVISW